MGISFGRPLLKIPCQAYKERMWKTELIGLVFLKYFNDSEPLTDHTACLKWPTGPIPSVAPDSREEGRSCALV